MAGDTVITVIGNLTADPELRWTQSGAAVADFTVASTPRTYDRNAGEWRDGDTLFMRCSVWRETAENVAEKYGITVRRVEFELEKAVKQLRVALKDYLPVLLMLLSDNILRS